MKKKARQPQEVKRDEPKADLQRVTVYAPVRVADASGIMAVSTSVDPEMADLLSEAGFFVLRPTEILRVCGSLYGMISETVKEYDFQDFPPERRRGEQQECIRIFLNIFVLATVRSAVLRSLNRQQGEPVLPPRHFDPEGYHAPFLLDWMNQHIADAPREWPVQCERFLKDYAMDFLLPLALGQRASQLLVAQTAPYKLTRYSVLTRFLGTDRWDLNSKLLKQVDNRVRRKLAGWNIRLPDDLQQEVIHQAQMKLFEELDHRWPAGTGWTLNSLWEFFKKVTADRRESLAYLYPSVDSSVKDWLRDWLRERRRFQLEDSTALITDRRVEAEQGAEINPPMATLLDSTGAEAKGENPIEEVPVDESTYDEARGPQDYVRRPPQPDLSDCGVPISRDVPVLQTRPRKEIERLLLKTGKFRDGRKGLLFRFLNGARKVKPSPEVSFQSYTIKQKAVARAMGLQANTFAQQKRREEKKYGVSLEDQFETLKNDPHTLQLLTEWMVSKDR